MEARKEERGSELRHGPGCEPLHRTAEAGKQGPLRNGLKEARNMMDLEHLRQVPVYTSDLYLELQRIEERGTRLRKQRKSWIAAILGLGRKNHTGAAETA